MYYDISQFQAASLIIFRANIYTARLTDSKADTQADKQTNVLYSCGLLTTTIAQINRNIYVSDVKLSKHCHR